jgi:hypothetical protein
VEKHYAHLASYDQEVNRAFQGSRLRSDQPDF